MQVRGVDFVGVAVPDVAAGKAFYRDVLGLPVAGESAGWVEFDLGNATVAVFSVPEEEIAGGRAGGWKNGVIALAVQDVAAAVEELRARGLSIVEGTAEYASCFMATVEDPFGNFLMLHARKDGTVG